MKPGLGLIILLLTCCCAVHARAASQPIAVLLSQEITPYIKAVRGIENTLSDKRVQRFFLDDRGNPYSLASSGIGLKSEAYAALVAIGPEALRYLQPRSGNTPLVYAMVLNPDNVLDPQHTDPCGVSLNIPVDKQLHEIRQAFPGLQSVGVLFDPANNATWFRRAEKVAASLQIELTPLQVKRSAGRISIIGHFTRPEALLFIPDKSIISKVIIQYVIKKAATRGVPVIGYNRFFYDSGAAMVFSIDYHDVGEQTAGLVMAAIESGGCSVQAVPTIETRINDIVLGSLKRYRLSTPDESMQQKTP